MAARKTGFIVGAVAGAGVAAAALAGVGMRLPSASAADAPGIVRIAGQNPVMAQPSGAPMSFADIFEKVSPAVVTIDVTSRVSAGALRQIPGFPFQFGPAPKTPEGGDGSEGGGDAPVGPKQQSSGSGFFISADGYIVTNNHVVDGADDIKVTLKDGRELKATVVGRDENTDLAVIKVQGSNFQFVSFENSAKPRVGDWVIAVGNPFGLGGTATAGIVSAYGRNLQDNTSSFVDYMQIDAPINKGNSGGPSFDLYGRVIGVNSAIFSPTGGSVGIGFAIPADVADNITKQLIAGGKVTRGYLGASIQNFTSDSAEAMGLGSLKAAIIASTTPGGPAQKGGLLAGDIVTSVNGVSVDSSTAMTREVAKASPGQSLRLELLRDGKKRSLEVKAGVRPTNKELAASVNGAGDSDENGDTPSTAPAQRPIVLGMALSPLDAATRARYKIDKDIAAGVVVENVKAGSEAADIGFARGRVIVSVNTRPVASAADVAAAVEAAKKAGRTSVLLGVAVGGGTSFIPLKIGG